MKTVKIKKEKNDDCIHFNHVNLCKYCLCECLRQTEINLLKTKL